MKLLILITFIVSCNSAYCKPSGSDDSTRGKIYDNIINLIMSDTALKTEMNRSNVSELCISNTSVWTSSLFFLREIVDYKFPGLNVSEKNEIYELLQLFENRSHPQEIQNFFHFKESDSCKVILVMSEKTDDMIRADVMFTMNFMRVDNIGKIESNSFLIYSYLFFINDNQIKKTIAKTIAF